MSKRSFFRSFSYAVAGIVTAFRNEQNFRIHVVAAVAVLTLAFLLDISTDEWLWVSLAIVLVMGAEMMNTAVELLADRVSSEQDPLIGHAKDCAAGAVLLTSLFAVVCGSVIFAPKMVTLFSDYAA